MQLFSTYNNSNKLAAYPKKGAARRRVKAKPKYVKKNPWLWVLSGALGGALISSSIFMPFDFAKKSIAAMQATKSPQAKPTATAKQVAEPTATAVTTNNTPTFDFYTVLPQMKSTYPTQSSKTAMAQTIAKPVQVTQQGKKFILQVKSFSTMAAADTLQAELALAGFEAHLEPMQKDNSTWYRVVVGPFATANAAEAQQNNLIKQNIYGSFIKEEATN